MNRVFLAIFVLAFGWTAWREVHWTPPPPAHDVAPAPPDSLERRLSRLESRVDGHPLFAAPARPEDRPVQQLTQGMLATSLSAVNLALGLGAVMTFFLGLMKVAEDAGLLQLVARAVRPLLVRLFPDVPPDHPAMGAMVMNLSANALGLGNAATPFGIKAMQGLDQLNPHPGVASDAMVLFLAINTASVTLLPTQVIAARAAHGSQDPAGIVPTTLLATFVATGAAIALARLFRRAYPLPTTPGRPIAPAVAEDLPPPLPGWATALSLGALAAAIPLSVVFGRTVGPWLIPGLAVGVLALGAWRGVEVYASFVAGAREGIETALRIIPYLVAILVAVQMLRTSGVMDAFTGVVGPWSSAVGLPAEALPMALLRPFSGSGANGILMGVLAAHGPDGYLGYLVSTIQGSSETTFYVLAVYCGAVQVRALRHAPLVGVLSDAVSVFASVGAVKLYLAWSGLSG